MARSDTSGDPQSSAGAGDGTDPPPRLRLKLATMNDVKSELARLYRQGKAGQRNIADVSKLANVLSILGRLIEGNDLAQRMDEFEKRQTK